MQDDNKCRFCRYFYQTKNSDSGFCAIDWEEVHEQHSCEQFRTESEET